MPGKAKTIQEVAEKRLCCGCGACAFVCPEDIRMVDVLDLGRRPLVSPGNGDGREALKVCPGIEVRKRPCPPGSIPELWLAWGPILEIWEGFASDHAIRHSGSSGGAATALSLFSIESAGMHGALHIAARKDLPYLNRTVLSRSREEILEAAGSRYSPASPCERLEEVEEAPAPCAFIGKPCDVAAVELARRLRPGLDGRIGVTIAIFCAGTPSTRGTLEMLHKMGITDPSLLRSLRYRGNGWPGKTVATFEGGSGLESRELSYQDSWGGILQKHRQWRCYNCADHTGEWADLAIADPWYRPILPDEPGRSMVLVRTEKGREFLRAARTAGYLDLEKAPPEILPNSQKYFPKAKGSVWGRCLALRLAGVPAPRYPGMQLFRLWWSELTLMEKVRSILGTFVRVRRKDLRSRARIEPFQEAVGLSCLNRDQAP